ncbi:hypothetical protein VTO42DRAFT_1785 [Malbranchea cinnamomea]
MSLFEPVHDQLRRRKTPPPGPFGFITESLIPPLDTPFEPAPAPPPGPALLDDSESNMLESFFTSMNSAQPDNDFWFTFGDPMNSDVKFGFEWPDIPPNFEGSTTSLPSHPSNPSISQSLSRDSLPMDHGRPSHPVTTSHASTLYQNGTDFMSAFGNQTYTENGVQEINPSDVKCLRLPSSSNGHYHQGRDLPRDIPTGIHTNRMIFDSDLRPADNSSLGKFGILRWGSDAGFSGDKGYQAPPDQPTLEERTSDLLQQMDCLESQSSAAPTRASSPVRKPSDRSQTEWNSSNDFTPSKTSSPSDDTLTTDENARPAKRRKSKVKSKEDDKQLEAALGKGGSHPVRPASKDRRFSSSDDPPRRSKTNPNKPPRENLTEEQKRANHILSEQRRRNLIKQGFEELCNIVPQLRGGGYSKSTMLVQAANWLQEILQGNELLKSQLAELKGSQ